MKNFYDLPDTSEINIAIELNATETSVVTVCVNKILLLIDQEIHGTITLETTIDVRSDLNIHIEATKGKVTIQKVHGDKAELMPAYVHLSTYSNSKEHPTLIINENNYWKLNTSMPLLWWIHEHSGNGWLLHP